MSASRTLCHAHLKAETKGDAFNWLLLFLYNLLKSFIPFSEAANRMKLPTAGFFLNGVLSYPGFFPEGSFACFSLPLVVMQLLAVK